MYPIPFLAIWLFWGTLALLVAAIGGYWLAGKALRPVKMITRTANEISATDLRRRLHLQSRDEFGELAATFDHMLARLEAAFKRQAQFTADASHELRTPLTIIDLEINRALTQLEQPEAYRHVLEQIQAENEQMTATVNSLLLLGRSERYCPGQRGTPAPAGPSEPDHSGDRRPAGSAGPRRSTVSGTDADQSDREWDQI
ncbi:MAG: HAMP domain-containing protein [Chloroflexi bacterium]|nr:MAG: HAMP domain-containing protein [Chloroflexota bacterium]